jgi:hypothetical protein
MADLVLRVCDRGDVSEATGHPLRDVYLYRRCGGARRSWLLRTGVLLAEADEMVAVLSGIAAVERDTAIPPGNSLDTGNGVGHDVTT